MKDLIQKNTHRKSHKNLHSPSYQNGFTLVEVMITLAIIAILAAVAVPAYQNSITKSKRNDGKNAIHNAAARMEQYYLDNKTYSTDMTDFGFAASPASSTEGYYLISAVAGADGIASSYTLSAVPQDSQVDDSCGTLTLTSDGVQGPSDCW